jgi:hypothetical protein
MLRTIAWISVAVYSTEFILALFLFYRVNNRMPPSGQIIMGGTPTPKAPPVLAQSGSAIDAAGGKLLEDKAVMVGAVNALGGGSRRRKHRGGAEVKVGSAPNFVSAGGVDTKQMFAGLLQAQHQASADAAYDKLGSAPPMQINTQTQEGGRRRRSVKKSPRRKHNGSKGKSIRKHHRSRRMSRRVRRSLV